MLDDGYSRQKPTSYRSFVNCQITLGVNEGNIRDHNNQDSHQWYEEFQMVDTYVPAKHVPHGMGIS